MFLTLLITEGRTPECSVKGRTEGLHCPPAQSAMPPLHKHECSDKLPQVSNRVHTMFDWIFWVYRAASHNASSIHGVIKEMREAPWFMG